MRLIIIAISFVLSVSAWARPGGGHVGGHVGGGHIGGVHPGHAPASGNHTPSGVRANPANGRYVTSNHVVINNRSYVSRTYVNSHGGYYHSYYAPKFWGGRPYYCYYHRWGFHPIFWGIYFGPWAPWYWTWPWFAGGWYVNYWYWYYAPYPVYYNANQWVTDGVYQDMLKEAYEDGVKEGRAMSKAQTNAPISRADKTQLEAQTDQIAKAFKNEQVVDVAEALKQPNYLFPVNQSYSFTPKYDSKPCTLAKGDVLKVVSTPGSNQQYVTVMVSSVKYGGCAAGTQIDVSMNDLQEMLNAYSERIDHKMHDLEKQKQGSNLPTP